MANPRGNPQNLRRFPKGQSGNPGGQRKGLSITRLVRDELQRQAPGKSGLTNADAIAREVVSLARGGNLAMIPLVWRYVDGDPKAAAELTLRELAERFAERFGLDADELYASFERDQQSA